MRIPAKTVHSDHGNLVSAQRSTTFSLRKAKVAKKQSFFFADPWELIFGVTPKKDDRHMKSLIKKYENQQIKKFNEGRKSTHRKFGSKIHRLGLDDQTGQFNLDNQLYYGPIFVGSTMQEMSLIFDTGSDWLMIEGNDCESCDNNKYDQSRSTFFNQRSSVIQNRVFGTIIHLQGREVID